jgi:hypothetical protein
MTTTAWAHLPNAKDIDRVLASLAAHPQKWRAAWDAARNAARAAARDAARGALWDAIAALIAWDDCAYMLELPEDELKILRAAGNEQAILLSAAAKVLREASS